MECSASSTKKWFGLNSTIPKEFEPIAKRLNSVYETIDWSLNATKRPAVIERLEREYEGREENKLEMYDGEGSSAIGLWLSGGSDSGGGGGIGGSRSSGGSCSSGGSRSSSSSTTTTNSSINSSGETKGSSSSNSTITKKKHKHVVKGIDWLPPSERDEAIPLWGRSQGRHNPACALTLNLVLFTWHSSSAGVRTSLSSM